jgi:DNA polymerase-3 subunit beta
MELVAPKKHLEKLLSRCQGVADKKSTMPVLANVLLSAEGSTLTIAATDLYLTISGSMDAEIKRPGSVALPARDVHERVKAMPDGPVKITVTNGSATTLQAVGSARRYTVHGLPGSDFPQLPEPAADAATIDISVAMLQKLVKRTIFSISNDETRPHLNSALFECRAAKGPKPGVVRMESKEAFYARHPDMHPNTVGFSSNA